MKESDLEKYKRKQRVAGAIGGIYGTMGGASAGALLAKKHLTEEMLDPSLFMAGRALNKPDVMDKAFFKQVPTKKMLMALGGGGALGGALGYYLLKKLHEEE
jgi:hypothetical protein